MHDRTKRILQSLSCALVAALGTGGCGADLGDCPTNSATQQAAGQAIVATKCATAGCHSSQNGGSAAAGLDLSSSSVVASKASDLYSEAESGSMPPAGRLSDADLEALRVYLACTQ